MIQTLDITNESEGKKKTICCKGQKFIVTLQKTQGERKKQNRNKINEIKPKEKLLVLIQVSELSIIHGPQFNDSDF